MPDAGTGGSRGDSACNYPVALRLTSVAQEAQLLCWRALFCPRQSLAVAPVLPFKG